MSEHHLTSALLREAGVPHGFSLRSGGVSAAPFDTLNLGRAVGDDPAAVEENHRLFAASVGYARPALREVSQVHGRAVVVADDDPDPATTRAREADAVVSIERRLAVGVRVADCVPILLADRRTGAVAAVHAGWRGVVARVLDATLDVLAARAGTRPEDLVVALGPHIRRAAFEVGEDVALELARVAHGADVVTRSAGERPRVDLAAILRAQLAARGVARGAIDDVGGCTQTESDRFFSFRRDGKRSGRHLAVIART